MVSGRVRGDIKRRCDFTFHQHWEKATATFCCTMWLYEEPYPFNPYIYMIVKDRLYHHTMQTTKNMSLILSLSMYTVHLTPLNVWTFHHNSKFPTSASKRLSTVCPSQSKEAILSIACHTGPEGQGCKMPCYQQSFLDRRWNNQLNKTTEHLAPEKGTTIKAIDFSWFLQFWCALVQGGV